MNIEKLFETQMNGVKCVGGGAINDIFGDKSNYDDKLLFFLEEVEIDNERKEFEIHFRYVFLRNLNKLNKQFEYINSDNIEQTPLFRKKG